VPAQLPGRAQTGAAGQFLQWVNPLAAVNHFLSKHLVNYRTIAEFWTWLISPVAFVLLVLGILFIVAGPGLRLDAGRSSNFFKRLGSRAGLAVFLSAILLAGATPVMGFQTGNSSAEDLSITIDLDTALVKSGDKVEFNTVVTNNGSSDSLPLIVAMNIINLNAQGDVVDPEDWSPQRTQYSEPLAPGGTVSHAWIINTILDGDYMVYMVLFPAPGRQDASSHPVASPGIHLTVTPFTRINPGGVLPYAVGGPVIVLIGILVLYRMRRRQIDND